MQGKFGLMGSIIKVMLKVTQIMVKLLKRVKGLVMMTGISKKKPDCKTLEI